MTDREREKNCVSQNIAETMQPVTEPMPKEKRAEVFAGSEPVAWAIERADGGSLMGFCHTKREATRFAHAIIEDTKSEHYALRTVPLYRHKQSTLTDAEREAIETAMNAYGSDNANPECAAIEAWLRGLLERLK